MSGELRPEIGDLILGERSWHIGHLEIVRSMHHVKYDDVTLLKEHRRTRKGMKDKSNRHGAVGKSSSEQHFRKSAAITFII